MTHRTLTEKIMFEAAMPDSFYHGTESAEAAEAIMREGLRPVQGANKPRTMMAPMVGRVYLTRDLKYACIYALGGDMAGSKLPEAWIQKSRYGYVFKSAPVEEDNVLPDEDQIGELIHDKKIPALNNFAQQHLTPRQFDKVMDGEYAYWAACGKKLNKIMGRHLRAEVMKHIQHVAHEGAMEVVEAWRFDKTLCPMLKKDCSNFFELAEKIM